MPAGAQEQATGLQHVAVNQMDKVTQQNAAMAEQATAASRSLAQETAELDRLINTFQLGEQAAARRRETVPQQAKPGAAKPQPLTARPALKTVAGLHASPAVRKAESAHAAADWKEF